MKPPTDVAAAVIVRDGTVLLTRRASGRHMARHWEFPGGTVEPGETVFECIEREIREELSLIVRPLRIYAENEHRYEATTIRLIAVLTEIVSGRIELSVHDDHAWIPISDLVRFRLAPADVPIATRLDLDARSGADR